MALSTCHLQTAEWVQIKALQSISDKHADPECHYIRECAA
jgi:hypothetical protein